MKNYVQPDESLDIITPSGGVVSGQGLLIGKMFGVVSADAAEGDAAVIRKNGVFSLPKATGAITAWAKVFWDDTAKKVTTVVSGNTFVGYCVEAAATNDTEAKILLAPTQENNLFKASRTVTSGEATANQADIDTGFGAAPTVALVQVYRSNVNVTADAVITKLTGGDVGKVRVADGAATYNMTAGDVIAIIAVA